MKSCGIATRRLQCELGCSLEPRKPVCHIMHEVPGPNQVRTVAAHLNGKSVMKHILGDLFRAKDRQPIQNDSANLFGPKQGQLYGDGCASMRPVQIELHDAETIEGFTKHSSQICNGRLSFASCGITIARRIEREHRTFLAQRKHQRLQGCSGLR